MTRVSGPDVVAAWGLFNGFLVAGLIGYGDNAIPIALYAGSAVLIELVALVTWRVMRTHPVWAARSPSPHRTRRSALLATAVALVGAGIIWSWWMALPALYPLAAMFTPEGGE
ncbi:MAG: hypothetical protein ACTHK4_13480 [Mycobacteriales bacterium]